MGKLVKIGIAFAVVAGVLAIFDFVMNPSGSPVRTALRTVRDTAVAQYGKISGQPVQPPAAEGEAKAAPTAPASAARRAASPSPEKSTTAPGSGLPARSSSAPAADAPPAPAAPVPPPPAPSASAAPIRGDFYLPGRATAWVSYNVRVASPLVIRAGGRVVAGNDSAGPNGLSTSNYERTVSNRRPAPGTYERALPSAPYLSLIGRVCSGDTCSSPFLIGSNKVVCPADVQLTGTLQLWTNNYVRVDGMQTSMNYSSAVGGYSFYVEPAPVELCSPGTERAGRSTSSLDAQALAAGQTLKNPEFVISSSQSSWKPFFLPLSVPIVVRASGSMQPRGGADPTGPRGIVVPDVPVWSYPGARDIVVDAQHRLFDGAIPYQALIGRLCGASGCSPLFLVGNERVICPLPPYDDRLELWVNHIIPPAGLLGSQTPLSLDAFDLQTRRGSYRFEVSRAPAAACPR